MFIKMMRMKKLLCLILFLLLFSVSRAPGLTIVERDRLYDRLWNNYSLLKYEAELDRFIDHL
jgi:hypothetical protein